MTFLISIDLAELGYDEEDIQSWSEDFGYSAALNDNLVASEDDGSIFTWKFDDESSANDAVSDVLIGNELPDLGDFEDARMGMCRVLIEELRLIRKDRADWDNRIA